MCNNDKSNILRQVITECTGHVSFRSYKHTKKSLKRKASDILADYAGTCTFYRFGLKWICSYEAHSFDVYAVYDETMGNGYLGNIEL